MVLAVLNLPHYVDAKHFDILPTHQATAAGVPRMDALGRVYTPVNSAAIYPREPILDISDAAWDDSDAINVKDTCMTGENIIVSDGYICA